ncbi:DNA-binding HxlR family transcriptional regulator [Clostridium acetobutylicum]|uniref:Predicted transcriptional regulator n=1 Tax=Clostridium acetobutylicum (strain ATCC 824 / DSM 792 / JCM 1419 / IAM 19013 / LMG 5710 / NBRC 13948 / NRRL B-527 / VKM B-1787 / 2291 / W) TaxID=272562 RepID=Q97F21_CLOAB|nr:MULTISPECIES: helix-turn-helix domain-containing protein [Clostridium]AAK80876.1 Predicted transcriptional regulator [Clostridium acetobutylicum ATCC 824]ADZ21978.1 transcriptional regulator [Clostridium acetobutylicum EA 2018]AEI32614.1 transcriptional regulator [Clostridium acetobutylicum DSM 1731]AWV78712.1 transcriptional regulator [Clostridium acetobutylicum]MBC2393575.1 helix-turn-helix transcriptional regulator [Clostridium acetobutylicum]
MIKYNDTEYQCSMELTLDIIGGKWKVLILWHLGKGTLRFGELMKTLPKITQKMLTQQLRSLEETGLINRFVYASVPPKVEYSLTDTGKSLLPILENLRQWALDYIEKNKAIL